MMRGFSWKIHFKQVVYVVSILFAFILQSTVSFTFLNHGFHIALVYGMLLLAIFIIPVNFAALLIFFFGLLTDLQSSNINGIYLSSYFFSLFPVFYFVGKMKKTLFFPIFIIIFITCFLLKTSIEFFFTVIFYNINFALIHIANSALLEAVLSTIAACTVCGAARLFFYKEWLYNLEKN